MQELILNQEISAVRVWAGSCLFDPASQVGFLSCFHHQIFLSSALAQNSSYNT